MFKLLKNHKRNTSRVCTVLFALFMSPIFDICDMITYADDNYIIEWDGDLNKAITKVKMKAEQAINWLKHAGMKVNSEKTEFCIFSKNDVEQQTITLMNSSIKSTTNMKVLGVLFDSKLNWFPHIMNNLNSCRSVLNGLRIIRKHFTSDEFLLIVNAFFYSKLYYASQIWLIPSLSGWLRGKIYSLSGHALRLVADDEFAFFSFKELHNMFNRANPSNYVMYSNACLLYSIITNQKPDCTWTDLQEKFYVNNRTNRFNFTKTNHTRAGLNCFSNRLENVTKQLLFSDFNLNKNTFKLKAKNIFLKP